jgi:hypothetical protein
VDDEGSDKEGEGGKGDGGGDKCGGQSTAMRVKKKAALELECLLEPIHSLL